MRFSMVVAALAALLCCAGAAQARVVAVDILSRALTRVVEEPSMRAQLEAQGLVPEAGSAGALGQVLKNEFDKWSRLIREANIKR